MLIALLQAPYKSLTMKIRKRSRKLQPESLLELLCSDSQIKLNLWAALTLLAIVILSGWHEISPAITAP